MNIQGKKKGPDSNLRKGGRAGENTKSKLKGKRREKRNDENGTVIAVVKMQTLLEETRRTCRVR